MQAKRAGSLHHSLRAENKNLDSRTSGPSSTNLGLSMLSALK
jgi:hypothetical protein